MFMTQLKITKLGFILANEMSVADLNGVDFTSDSFFYTSVCELSAGVQELGLAVNSITTVG